MRRIRGTGTDYLPPDKYLTIEQVNTLRQSVCIEAERARQNGSRRGLVNWMLIELMLETGLRAEEVCCLKLEDMPTYHGKDVVRVRHGKGDVLRTVNVKQSMKDKIAEYVRLCRKGAKPGSPMFVTEAGQRLLRWRVGRKGKVVTLKERTARLSYHELYMRIRHIGKRAGIDNLYPHKLRHTFATFLYNTEKDVLFVQRQMGHSRPEITSRYSQPLDEAGRRQTEALYSQSDVP
ncbi:MAG: site-specific integrase [Sedimentisphaerales bacterium]